MSRLKLHYSKQKLDFFNFCIETKTILADHGQKMVNLKSEAKFGKVKQKAPLKSAYGLSKKGKKRKPIIQSNFYSIII